MLSDEFYEDLDRALEAAGRYGTDYDLFREMASELPSEGVQLSGRWAMLPPANSLDAPHWRSLWAREAPGGS